MSPWCADRRGASAAHRRRASASTRGEVMSQAMSSEVKGRSSAAEGRADEFHRCTHQPCRNDTCTTTTATAATAGLQWVATVAMDKARRVPARTRWRGQCAPQRAAARQRPKRSVGCVGVRGIRGLASRGDRP